VLEVVSAFSIDFYWNDAYRLDPRRIDTARRITEHWTRALVAEVRRDAETAGLPGVRQVEIRVLVVAGAAAEHLVDRSRDAEVLVVGRRGRGAAVGALLGSVSLRCVMHAHCPVVVVHGGAGRAAADGSVRTVVVGVDGSPTARAALEVAAREARVIGARLSVVAAYQPADTRSAVQDGSGIPADDLRASVRSAVSADMSEVLGDEGAPRRRTVDLEVVEGPPAAVLVERAAGAELLVVGSRGQGTLPGIVLGSVALRVVVGAGCPVMVVHLPERPAASGAAPRLAATAAV
jgi:nucleotide-binding universal stress UspA family protein